MPTSKPARALSDAQIEQFIQDGFVRIDRAFPRELAEQGRTIARPYAGPARTAPPRAMGAV